MFKSSSRRIILALTGMSSISLFINRRIQYNHSYDTIREYIVNCTGVNDALPSRTAIALCEPVKFIYDYSDKQLRYYKLQTFAELLKTALIELIPNDNDDNNEDGDNTTTNSDDANEHVKELPNSVYSLLTCRSGEFMFNQIAKEIARQHKHLISDGISFIYIYPEKPITIKERFQIFIDYIKGKPKWLDSFGKTTVVLSNWLSVLGQSLCPLKNIDSDQVISMVNHLPLIMHQDRSYGRNKRIYTCALDGITTETCVVRYLQVIKSSANSFLDESTHFSFWHPSTWFYEFRPKQSYKWTEWTHMKDLKISRGENRDNPLKVKSTLENGDSFTIECKKCEIKKGCCLKFINRNKRVSYRDKNPDSNVTVEIANPQYTPTFILLNPKTG
ncbi:hypothetical protein GJ496_001662 [Pomphorhynchus laevis]|nr:hypothetical protein GJ496_001662 [Pomphorhynchus laevis]